MVPLVLVVVTLIYLFNCQNQQKYTNHDMTQPLRRADWATSYYSVLFCEISLYFTIISGGGASTGSIQPKCPSFATRADVFDSARLPLHKYRTKNCLRLTQLTTNTNLFLPAFFTHNIDISMNALVQLLAMALAAVVVLAFVPTGVDADCQLALTTWYSKQGDCQGQSGCSAGMVPNGCSKLGDQWVDVDCSNERVLIYSTQVHLLPASVVLYDQELTN